LFALNNKWKKAITIVLQTKKYQKSFQFELRDLYILSERNEEDAMKEFLRELDKETCKIVVSKDIRGRYKKSTTVITGIQASAESIAKTLKSKIGTGGTYKDGKIILQGDHRDAVKQFLIGEGFNEGSIEVL
jgi:translation initiation factor 1